MNENRGNKKKSLSSSELTNKPLFKFRSVFGQNQFEDEIFNTNFNEQLREKENFFFLLSENNKKAYISGKLLLMIQKNVAFTLSHM